MLLLYVANVHDDDVCRGTIKKQRYINHRTCASKYLYTYIKYYMICWYEQLMMCVEQESESRVLNRFGASPKAQQSRIWVKERKRPSQECL